MSVTMDNLPNGPPHPHTTTASPGMSIQPWLFEVTSFTSYFNGSNDSINGTFTVFEESTLAYDYAEYTEGDSGICVYVPYGSFFLPAVYSLFFVLGLLGNGLVLWVILSRPQLRSVTDLCLLNLGVADLLLVASLPFLAHQAGQTRWVFGDFLCQAVLGVYRVGFYAGIFFLTLMSMDRYLAIVHAVYAMRARTRTAGRVAVALTWLAGVLASFPELANHGELEHNGTAHCTTTYDGHGWTVFGLYKMNVLGLLLPLGVMAFCYTQIVRRLLRGPSSKKQAVRLVAAVVAVFFCCWAPYNLALFVKALDLSQGITLTCEGSKALRLAIQITETLAYFHSCLNPLLYVFVGQKFRRHLVRLVLKAPCGVGGVLNAFLPQDSRRESVYSQTASVEERFTTV